MAATCASSGDATRFHTNSESQVYGLQNVSKGMRIRGFVSYVVDPMNFYIQFVTDLPYAALSAELQDEYDLDVMACPPTNQLREGHAYAIMWSGLWVRVLLEKLLFNGNGLIFFLDSGHRKTVRLSDIFELNSKFIKLPAQAVFCQLSGVQPSVVKDPVWQEERILFFKSLIKNCKVIAKIENIIHGEVGRVHDKELTLQVTLFTDLDETSINNKLITSGYYIAREPDAQQNAVALISQTYCGHSTSSYSSACSTHEEEEAMEAEDSTPPDHLVNMCHVVDPGHFYVQRLSDESQRNHIRNLLDSTYRNEDQMTPARMEIRTAEYYAIRSPTSQLWYRSRCVSPEDALSGYSHDYFLIDEGYTLRIFKKCVRSLTAELRKYPAMALGCRLELDNPEGGWSSSDVETFKKLTENRLLRMVELRKVDGVLSVDLAQVANASGEQVVDSIRNRLLYRNPKKSRFRFYSASCGDRMTGRILRSFNPSHIYIQPDAIDNKEFSAMNAQLQVECNVPSAAACLAVESPGIGYAYAAPRSNGTWGRAVLEIAVSSIDKFAVLFVDYGERRQVERSQLRHLRERFLKVPARVIRCKLGFIRPNNPKGLWPKKSIAVFKEALVGVSNVTVKVQKSLFAMYQPRRFLEALLIVKLFPDSSHASMNSLLVDSGEAVWSGLKSSNKTASLMKRMLANRLGSRPSVLNRLGHVTAADWLTVDSLAAEVTALECPSRPFCPVDRKQAIGRMPPASDYVMAVRFLMCQSPDSIFFRPIPYESRYLNLQSQLQLAYRNVIRRMPCCNPGTWCAAYVYGQWIRAAILDFDENLQCSISSLDTGQVHRISVDQIYPLLEPFICVPRLAIKCSLINRPIAIDEVDLVSKISNALLLAEEIFISCRQRPRAISSNMAVTVVFRRRSGDSDVFINLNEVLQTEKRIY